MVVPNVCGIAVWSPRLDDIGNSVRGVATAKELLKYIAIHNFEVFSGLCHDKIDPTKRKHELKQKELGNVLFAASEGDVAEIETAYNCGTNIFLADYDDRTALHLAAAEGREKVVRFIIDHIPKGKEASILSFKDRWSGTPLDDALTSGHTVVAEMLKEAGIVSGKDHVEREDEAHHVRFGSVADAHDGSVVVSPDAPTMLFAAAEDDVDELIRCVASGMSLLHGDYDKRTALHLAASTGSLKALEYVIGQMKLGNCLKQALNSKDRWGNTAADDCQRENRTECAAFLAKAQE
jgi:glutaminase